ncbi:hypothetical protein CYLTODRAFT_459043 [Cylindrobasidium torrendii FP15055 ss-10]|uniref:Uncharacterized protein n=1 Tax=Cylindrobasidium torrendii FP15055 ss-10 TaxID=1314674 RepID=A0A0D7AW03_9AGAR|nr:hypothetical protein CYLTODRAFT_459043 [Cylindrobasidium torrendii FP15055 ss-10]
MRALHPDVHRDSSSPDNDTPSKPPMKRRLGGPPPDDPFVSDEDIERPRKKARFAEDPTTPSAPAQNPAPAATTRPPRRRLVFPAAMQEPRYRTSQAVAGPGPRTAANRRGNAQTQQQTVAGPPVSPMRTRSFRSAMTEASRSRATESTFASRARSRGPTDSQPSQIPRPALPKDKGKDKDKDKDKLTRQ